MPQQACAMRRIAPVPARLWGAAIVAVIIVAATMHVFKKKWWRDVTNSNLARFARIALSRAAVSPTIKLYDQSCSVVYPSWAHKGFGCI
tara:strand:+ start:1516 stop:1782 length:267 start_codon:yes stop_codon:yes gene_type:complete